MPITKLRPTFTFDEDRLAALRAVVPEAFADGRINWETLRAALGEHLEDEDAEGGATSTAEHFGLFWPGKRAARRLASAPSRGTLAPQPGLGVHEATTRNLFIEGDNLEVLKLLLKSYAGRVKLIYIDPPYNTGNDFVYPDDYAEPLDAYLRRTGQVDEEGQALTTNKQAGGRFHSNWLSMMYPRLLLARQLLREDGSVFINIDNNEIHNLRLIMDEIFGPENFVDCLVWQKKVSPSNDAKWFSSDHDYILVYARSKEIWRLNRLPHNERQKSYYRNPDNDPRGPWNSATYTCNKTKDERPNLYYPLTNPNTGQEVWPKETAVWAYSREQYEKHVEENRLYWGIDGDATMPRYKLFFSEARKVVPRSVWLYTEVGHTQEATREFQKLFPEGGFDTPKPPRLINRILHLSTDSEDNDIVLDFFSGSSTTAQAVLEFNQEDTGNRRFIMVQLPEPTGNTQYPTIADIGRERIRRVIARIEAEAGQPAAVGGQAPDDGQLPLLEPGQPSAVSGQEPTGDARPTTDLGFKSYRLTRSHFKAWQAYTGEDPAALETLFTQFESPLAAGWEPEALLTEVLLLEGFPLDSRVRLLPAFTENALVEVTSDFCAHRLTVCLDAQLHPATLAALELRAEDTFICLDSALTDEAKITLADRCNLKVV